MRNIAILLTATALAGCGGGAQTVGSAGSVSTGTVTTGGTPTDTFVAPTTIKIYQAQTATQSYSYNYDEHVHYNKVQGTDPATGAPMVDANGNPVLVIDANSRTVVDAVQSKQLYTANASTVRSPASTVTYDPRNAEFTLVINDTRAGANISFQDPAHRTDFSGATTPQRGVPNLEVGDPSQWRTKGVQYLQVDSGSTDQVYDVTTFFYELPTTATNNYVSYAGYVRNHYDAPTETVLKDTLTGQDALIRRSTKLDRAAFVFGQQTSNNAVPVSGSATYTGNMIASMVNNPDFDIDPAARTYFQWISGTATVAVNFGSGVVNTSLTGTVGAPLFDATPIKPSTNSFTPPAPAIATGSSFSATSSAAIDLLKTGGFTGQFGSASFVSNGVTKPVDIVGSSLDGAFYGPKAEEIGASFRVVGGVPDQRVDIIGAFIGKKP